MLFMIFLSLKLKVIIILFLPKLIFFNGLLLQIYI